MTNFTIDLDSYTCSSDPLEAIEYLFNNNNVIFKIKSANPYFEIIKDRYTINIIKQEGDTIYFIIRYGG
ncbi:hypothetical protein SULI_01055 [Saccharolobus solfataricus]|nr:hypothetical protein [Saccharolobus solfataricus]AKA72648.1 hypothetical protein SULB_0209 [Saccharolobus solfataricus]AKA75348.1 hypothetical protein SULC_0208 [Saccharolobus solfataricus]AKA78040.1 hypothetical protein SULA_0208 [Saccharolobus solfataricus]AZF67161.1 hypothetical protein SULG_01055 [Saccharolobus solfataricus]AZF69781.1 hypothetical protein SULH_01055 [Saccharolobus solfataricus]